MFYFDRIMFSIYMKVWRNLHDLTMRDMAELCGIVPSAISYLEANDRPPEIETLVSICNVMSVEPCHFFRNKPKGQ